MCVLVALLPHRYFRTDLLRVQKRIHRWTNYASATATQFATVQRAYKVTAGCQGLIHACDPPSLIDDKYTVELAPVGLQHAAAPLASEDSICAAAHGLLHGLVALHKVGLGGPLMSLYCAHVMHSIGPVRSRPKHECCKPY